MTDGERSHLEIKRKHEERMYASWLGDGPEVKAIGPDESIEKSMIETGDAFSGVTTMEESTNPKDALGRTKPPLHLIPPPALVHMATAMRDGANKYGPYNWRKKTVSASVYVSAAMRHIVAWFDGEETADDSGLHHLAHALASLGILVDAQEQGMLVDDRPTPGKTAELLKKHTQGQVHAVDRQGLRPVYNGIPVDYTESLGESSDYLISADRRPRCYIAGPMRGLPKLNFPAFDNARDQAIARGWSPISPADLDRQHDIHEDFDPDTDENPALVRAFVQRDTEALLSLRAENGDAVVLLPGWEKSAGAVAEFFIARWLGLRVLDGRNFTVFTNQALPPLVGIGADAYHYLLDSGPDKENA